MTQVPHKNTNNSQGNSIYSLPLLPRRAMGVNSSRGAGKSPLTACTDSLPILRMKARNETMHVKSSVTNQREVYRPIWYAIEKAFNEAQNQLKRPAGIMIRFTMLNDEGASSVMRRIVERLSRKGRKPLYVWAREVKERDYEGRACEYDHYHAILFFDKQCHSLAMVIEALRDLQERGWLESFHISQQGTSLKVHDLTTADGYDAFKMHCSYLAKVKTKTHSAGRRAYGHSQWKNCTTAKKPIRQKVVKRERTVADKEIEAASRKRCNSYLERSEAMLNRLQMSKQLLEQNHTNRQLGGFFSSKGTHHD